MDKVTQAKAAWEAITEDDEDATLEWALEHGDTVLHAATAAYAPDRITPEVVEAAARAIYEAQKLQAGQNPPWRSLTVKQRKNWLDEAEAALLAAFAVLGGA